MQWLKCFSTFRFETVILVFLVVYSKWSIINPCLAGGTPPYHFTCCSMVEWYADGQVVRQCTSQEFLDSSQKTSTFALACMFLCSCSFSITYKRIGKKMEVSEKWETFLSFFFFFFFLHWHSTVFFFSFFFFCQSAIIPCPWGKSGVQTSAV